MLSLLALGSGLASQNPRANLETAPNGAVIGSWKFKATAFSPLRPLLLGSFMRPRSALGTYKSCSWTRANWPWWVLRRFLANRREKTSRMRMSFWFVADSLASPKIQLWRMAKEKNPFGIELESTTIVIDWGVVVNARLAQLRQSGAWSNTMLQSLFQLMGLFLITRIVERPWMMFWEMW